MISSKFDPFHLGAIAHRASPLAQTVGQPVQNIAAFYLVDEFNFGK
jgi:hypothetical protein